MRAWDIYQEISDEYSTRTFCINTVFFDDDCDAPYVYNSLVNHDGYDSSIYLEWEINTEEGTETKSYPSEWYEEYDEYDRETVEVVIHPTKGYIILNNINVYEESEEEEEEEEE